jgi:Sugar (and other) transporter
MAKGRRAEAQRALEFMGVHESDAKLHAIEQSLAVERSESSQKLSWHMHRKPILLAVGVALFNQLAGINAILYYANDIFAAAGYSGLSSDLQTVAIGATNLLFTVLALLVIDRVGRKTLLLIGAAGMAVCLAVASLVMFGRLPESQLIFVLIGFIAFFAFSQGAVIWVYISEIFPTPVRARGQSLGSSTHWLLNALISAAFPVAAAYSKGAPFAFFAAMMLVQFFVVWFFFPETKGVSLENMRGALRATQ